MSSTTPRLARSPDSAVGISDFAHGGFHRPMRSFPIRLAILRVWLSRSFQGLSNRVSHWLHRG